MRLLLLIFNYTVGQKKKKINKENKRIKRNFVFIELHFYSLNARMDWIKYKEVVVKLLRRGCKN